ncbi:glycosyltransferase, partial [Micrococcus sp.]|uniref:glycosyltransferase n=1 Tax=Micrococcus sp. TaxID=1271 RepID=UPI0026DD2B1A
QPEELDALVDAADASLGPGGELLLCHWRQPITGWPLDGDAVHDRVAADPRWRLLSEHVEADLRLSVHTRASAATHAVVVVPAKDEAEHLPDSLAGLSAALDRWEAQHTQGSAVAVVAVPDDDAPTLAAARAARARDPRIHVLELAPGAGGVGRARAEAARHARGLLPDVPAEALWLGSTDADTRVPADWLVGQPALAARRRADGQVLVLGTVDLPAHADEDLARSWRADYEHREGHPHVHGANLGLPWALYERAGGFAAVSEHEDVRLAEAVRALGEDRVLATDRVRVHTSSRLEGRTPGGFAGFLRDLLEEASAEG